MGIDVAGCPQCGSSRVVAGQFVGVHQSVISSAWFRFEISANLLVQFFKGRRRRISAPYVAHLCLDCSLAWTIVDPIEATEAIRRHGSRPLQQSLGLVERSIMADAELDGPT